MRTIDDCLHALKKAAASNHFTVIEKGVAADTMAHLLKVKSKTFNCFECSTPLLGPICPACNSGIVTIIHHDIRLPWLAGIWGFVAGAVVMLAYWKLR